MAKIYDTEKIWKYKDFITHYDVDRDIEFIYTSPRQLIFLDTKDDTGISIIGTKEGILKFMSTIDSFDPCVLDDLEYVGFRLWKKEG